MSTLDALERALRKRVEAEVDAYYRLISGRDAAADREWEARREGIPTEADFMDPMDDEIDYQARPDDVPHWIEEDV